MKKVKLNTLLTIKNGRNYSHLRTGNVPVYGSGGLMTYVDDYLYNGKSILLPRKGTLDNIQFVNGKFWTVDTIYYTEVNSQANSYFLYNYLKLLNLNRLDSGSTLPSMTQSSYYDIVINLPEKKVQDEIAEAILNIDKKIQLNNQINAVLETMAKLIYDYWFVQFDFPDENGKPYKSSGEGMVWNEELNREIPKGWEVGSLLDIADYTNGIACQKYSPVDNDSLPVIKIKEMRDGYTSSTEFVRSDIPSKVIVNDGDVLFSWSASLEVMVWSGGKGGLNQHIFKVTSDKFPRSFYYFQLTDYVCHFRMIAENRKTTMGHITQDHLKQSRIAIPPLTIIKDLDMKLDPIIRQIVLNKKQNQALNELRDWLLPMLMNGQVKVSE